jgi:Tfp pilus assembly protein PilN
MINKLRRRFIHVAMLSVTLVLILLIVAVNAINFASFHRDLTSLLTTISENDGSVPAVPDGKRPERKKDPRLNAETPFSTRYFTLHYLENGALLDSNLDHIAAVTQEDAQTYVSVALNHGVGVGYSGPYIYQVTPDKNGGFQAVFLNCQTQLYSLRTYALGSVGAGALCVLLVYLLILFFSKKAIQPSIESLEKQKQFITDASHELKTPLTVISTSQTVLEMEVGRQKWIDKTLAQVEKMRALVDELVTLSRMDEEHPPLQAACFDISDAVTETAESFRDFAQSEGHPLTLEVAPGISFCGDQLAVRRLVSVLMDNAVKYCEEGGEISLSLVPARKGVQLTVRNRCQPMEPSELDRLFDRFYRVDRSRSRQTGGFGVGLSIARSIAETHRGSIRAFCPSPDTIEFVAVLNPLKPTK